MENDTNADTVRDAGNAAAMRAALRDLLMWLDEHGHSYSYAADTPDDEVKAIWRRREEIVGRARAALAAPPRNCDRFATVDEAKAEWLRTNAKLLSSTGLMPFESWLFAKAKCGAE